MHRPTANTAFTRNGSFTDPGTADTWTATVDYATARPDRAVLNPNKTFSLQQDLHRQWHVHRRRGREGQGQRHRYRHVHVTVTGGTQQQTTYLSDLTPTGTPINGWGPYEKDHSNGEANPNDGGPIKIAGVTYGQGSGHPRCLGAALQPQPAVQPLPGERRCGR
jgi:hypothetical protein